MNEVQRVVLISGGSSGIGRATARYFVGQGDIVYELSRSGSEQDGIHHITADVTQEEQLKDAVQTVLQREGRIDVLVNNAGYGISGAIEHTDTGSAINQFDVNFFGMVRLTRLTLPALKASKGRIINISSVAGVLPIPFQSFYSASKAAINSYTCCLANEVRPFDIKACALMPGDVKTGFTAVRQKATDTGEYGERISKSVATMEHDEQNGMQPELIARDVYRLSVKRSPRPINTAGAKYKFFVFLSRFLSSKAINWILFKLY